MRRLSPAPCAPRAGWLALCARLCEHRHSVSVAACVMRSSPRDSTHTEGIRMHTAQRLNALQSPRIQQQSAHSCMHAWLPAYDLSHHFNAGFGAQPRGEKNRPAVLLPRSTVHTDHKTSGSHRSFQRGSSRILSRGSSPTCETEASWEEAS